MATEKTFYLETFGCQMNAHDSEKVIGTLRQQGYRQVESEEDASTTPVPFGIRRNRKSSTAWTNTSDSKKQASASACWGA